MFDTQLMVGGRDVAAVTGARFERRHPATQEVVSRAAAASSADALPAVEAARAALPVWAGRGPGARRAVLVRASSDRKRGAS